VLPPFGVSGRINDKIITVPDCGSYAPHEGIYERIDLIMLVDFALKTQDKRKDADTIYFAYGSNINIEQMKYRCPTARPIGKGMLNGYRLFFKGRKGGAYATIEEKEGACVPVLVWKLKPEDEKALDYYEGYPRFYEKKMTEVTLPSGKRVIGMVYIMTDGMIDRLDPNMPDKRYLEAIVRGYEMSGLDQEYIHHALEDTKKKMMEKRQNN
jgi:gamma-glutamylcyclotransferase (GGCT)/AIG2-like uncharacterized protein YtfP